MRYGMEMDTGLARAIGQAAPKALWRMNEQPDPP
jgi:hypothetical protein